MGGVEEMVARRRGEEKGEGNRQVHTFVHGHEHTYCA